MIRIILSFARSGGTLLNKCLGSLPDVVMLSEVNPLGGGWGSRREESFTTVQDQAHHWYGIPLKSHEFGQAIHELHAICEGQSRYLIVRDWSLVNFVPNSHNKFSPPYEFLTLKELECEGELRIIGFVRDSIDVWISRSMPPIEEFYATYSKYAQALNDAGVPVFRYEDFTRHPKSTFMSICDYLEVPYDSGALDKYHLYKNAHGDTQIQGGSRGSQLRSIRPLPRRKISWENIRKIDRCKAMQQVNRLWNYPTSYHQSIVGLSGDVLKRTISRLKRYLIIRNGS